MIIGTLNNEGFICQEYTQRPYGSQRIRQFGQIGYREEIPGGTSSGMTPGDFNRSDLDAGIEVEMEHTPIRKVAQEIAMDHLVEDPDYYRKLATLHMYGASLRAAADEPGVFDIEGRAAAGAKKAIKPMIVGSMVLGGAGLVLGVVALVVAIRR